MGQLIARWQRPGLETTAGDHERRIGILERLYRTVVASGWRFNITNQEPGGGYGLVVVDDEVNYAPAAAPSPRSEWSFIVDDEFGSGILLISQDVVNDEQAMVWATPDVANLTVRDGPTVGVARDLGAGQPGAYAFLTVGDVFRVIDASGIPIFQVDEDGTIHTKAGATMVADL